LRTNGPCGGTQSILAVYNIKDIANPLSVNQVPVGEPYGLGYADDALYVCNRWSLIVFDITKPYDPLFVTELYDAEYYDVIPQGNTLVCWINGGVALYDITERLVPKLITIIR
jgi:hypothetical protein